jgi:asparagine synthase (glutamine-hydrolysing)
MPSGAWLRGELAPYAEAALTGRPFRERGWIEPAFVRRMLDEHRAGAHDRGETLWTLFVLEVWARMALDGTLARTDSLEALL